MNYLSQLHIWVSENHNYLYSSTCKRKSSDGSSASTSSTSLSRNLKETLNELDVGQFNIIKAMVTGVELSENCPGKLYGTFCKFEFLDINFDIYFDINIHKKRYTENKDFSSSVGDLNFFCYKINPRKRTIENKPFFPAT